jgi:hypothetical protein
VLWHACPCPQTGNAVWWAHAQQAKYIIQRISTETVKLYGRKLGKLAHSNMGPLFDYILDKIQVLCAPTISARR